METSGPPPHPPPQHLPKSKGTGKWLGWKEAAVVRGRVEQLHLLSQRRGCAEGERCFILPEKSAPSGHPIHIPLLRATTGNKTSVGLVDDFLPPHRSIWLCLGERKVLEMSVFRR